MHDFPAPFRPSKPVTFPVRAVMYPPLTTVLSPKRTVRNSAGELLSCVLKKEAELHVILQKLYESSYEPEADRIIRDCLHAAVHSSGSPETRRICVEYILYGLLKDRIEEKNTDPEELVYLQYAGAVSALLRLR